jgi:uncharacterized protein (DUF2147 family)
MKNLFSTILIGLMASIQLVAQNPLGMWRSVDDKTGQAKSIIEIYEHQGEVHGKITQLLQKPQDSKCEKCSGDKKGQPVVGMTILWGLKAKDAKWSDGAILDPESGKEYKCTIWFENNKNTELKVRGYHWSGIYRTQTWYRVK